MEVFKKLLEEKYGDEFEIYSISKYQNKLYASLTPKDTEHSERQLIYKYDAPTYVLENGEIKEVYGIEQSVIPFVKGQIVYKHPTLFEEDEEDCDV